MSISTTGAHNSQMKIESLHRPVMFSEWSLNNQVADEKEEKHNSGEWEMVEGVGCSCEMFGLVLRG